MDLIATALDQPANYLEWGWLSISVPNLVILLVMVVLFIGALLLPFPKDGDEK